MKVFVYKKDHKSQLFKVVNHVETVKVNNGMLVIIPEDGMALSFDTKKFKTTIYQN